MFYTVYMVYEPSCFNRMCTSEYGLHNKLFKTLQTLQPSHQYSAEVVSIMAVEWFNIKAKRVVRRKYFACKRYLETRSYARYKEYVKRINQTTKKLRAIKRKYEKEVCKRIKIFLKHFHWLCLYHYFL